MGRPHYFMPRKRSQEQIYSQADEGGPVNGPGRVASDEGPGPNGRVGGHEVPPNQSGQGGGTAKPVVPEKPVPGPSKKARTAVAGGNGWYANKAPTKKGGTD